LSDLGGDVLHGALALGQHIDDLDPAPARQRLGDLGEPVAERFLGSSAIPTRSIPLGDLCQAL